MADSIKVVLTDDHAVVRAGYRFLLENIDGIEVVAEASTGEQAIEKYNEALPDVLIMDLSMPGIGGMEACRRLLQKNTR